VRYTVRFDPSADYKQGSAVQTATVCTADPEVHWNA
jgi:hypothetical protein